MEAKHIEDFKGRSGKFYTPNLFFKFPYNEDFSKKDCICIFITRYYTKKIISCFIEFKELVNNETYNTLDIKGFKPYGIALIKSTKESSEGIIKDLKENEDFFFEKIT